MNACAGALTHTTARTRRATCHRYRHISSDEPPNCRGSRSGLFPRKLILVPRPGMTMKRHGRKAQATKKFDVVAPWRGVRQLDERLTTGLNLKRGYAGVKICRRRRASRVIP